MFNKFIRFYNQNRKLVIAIIVVILAVLILIQLLNQMATNELKAQNSQNKITQTEQVSSTDKSANTLKTESIASGTNISQNTAQTNQTLINSFIEYCNNKDIANAYALISDECKEELFTTQQEFKTKYVDNNFSSKKQYNIQNWYTSNLGSTYKITYINDILASGNVENNIEDYITVSNNKLNILRYIGKIEVNKSASNKNVSIIVLNRKIYDEYEIYNLKVSNLSNNTIMLNRHEDNGGIYATYNNSKTYKAIISETYSGNLTLEPNQTKYVSIKINKMYNGEIKAKNINFSDIINNKQEFDIIKNKATYTNISTLEINL